MNLFNFPVKRPVTVVMGMLIAVLVGGIALWKTPLDLMPEITFPNLMAIIRYEGAGPEEIERTVARPLEGVIKTVGDIKNVYSTSAEGRDNSELGKIAEDQVAPLLERIPGVASVMVLGSRHREIQVNLNKDKLI